MISIDKIFTRLRMLGVLLFMLSVVHFSCKKDILQEDPYAGGMESLGIKFNNEDPDPNSGIPGTQVTFKVKGLLGYKDKFEFLINETKAEILGLTDSTLTVKVPEQASSGGTTVVLQGQSFFGPKFTVEGKVNIDPTFKVANGTNGPIMDAINTTDGGYIMVGLFRDFENQSATTPVNSIFSMSRDGAIQTSLKFGEGANGLIYSINRLSNGQFMIGGLFNNFHKRIGLNSITRLNVDGSLDSTIVEVVNTSVDNPLMGVDTVAKFNGGVYGVITKTFVRDNKTTAIGSFDNYVNYYYFRSTRELKIPDVTKMNTVVRFNEDGSLDKTFNYNEATKQSYAGANGFLNSGIMLSDGKIIGVGSFTTFNGVRANRIVRLNTDGSVDESFAVGTGADDVVNSITQNAVTKKIMITGAFKNFNGKAAEGVVMLNEDGSVDSQFKLGSLIGGLPSYATQLNNGKVIISGAFDKYNNVVRQGFMVLNADGSLASGYNNTGAFQGVISKIIETTTALGTPGLLIIGNFYKFNNTRVGNIVRVEFKN